MKNRQLCLSFMECILGGQLVNPVPTAGNGAPAGNPNQAVWIRIQRQYTFVVLFCRLKYEKSKFMSMLRNATSRSQTPPLKNCLALELALGGHSLQPIR